MRASPGIEDRRHNVELRLSRSLFRSWAGFAQIFVLLEFLEEGRQAAHERIVEKRRMLFARSIQDPAMTDAWLEKPVIGSDAFESQVRDASEKAVLSAEISVHAAAVVFSHSIIDDLIHEYLEALAYLDPQLWEDRLMNKRKFSLEELRESSFENIYQSELSKNLQELRKDSLMKKVEVFMAKCPPEPTNRLYAGPPLDMSRLRDWDSTRIDIVHRNGLERPIEKLGEELFYLQQLGVLWFSSMNHHYGVNLIANEMLQV